MTRLDEQALQKRSHFNQNKHLIEDIDRLVVIYKVSFPKILNRINYLNYIIFDLPNLPLQSKKYIYIDICPGGP